MNAPAIRLSTAPNFRDLGGVRAADGRLVRSGLIFRSEAIIAPDEADIAALTDAGIVLVCDLRGQTERDHKPNLWWAARGVELVEMDILADIRGSSDAWAGLRADPTAEGGQSIMHAIYRDLPLAAAPHLATIFRRIAAGDVPLLIHCTAGKDRTGFLSAMILSALGVPYDVILADYLSSGARINQAVIDATRRLIVEKAGSGISEGAMAAVTGVDASYLDQSIAAIETRFGSVEAYLADAVGLDPALAVQVRGRLLD